MHKITLQAHNTNFCTNNNGANEKIIKGANYNNESNRNSAPN